MNNNVTVSHFWPWRSLRGNWLCIFNLGAFLIPYFLCLAIAGIPIFFLELGIGQRLRRGSVACWNEISPYLGGIGIGCMIVSFLVAVYYNMIIGWSFYYMFISMQEKLPYQTCESYNYTTPGNIILLVSGFVCTRKHSPKWNLSKTQRVLTLVSANLWIDDFYLVCFLLDAILRT